MFKKKIFKKIFIIFIIVAQFSFINSNAQEGVALYKKEWKSCIKDEECIVVKGLCSKWVAVNEQYKENIENMKHKYATLMFCGILPDAEGILPNTKCKNDECVLTNDEDENVLY